MIEKELLLKARLFEEDYDIPDVGTVRIRCLSWDECAEQQAWTSKGKPIGEVYARILHLALVDPALTEEEARRWLAGAPGGEVEDLVRHVTKVSGLAEGAQKSV